MLYNNQINKITVTKNVDKAESSDREFTFGFYKNADGSGDSVATISVTVSANKKTGSHTISMNSEKDNEPFYSLRTSNLYLYEIDEKDNVVSNGGIYQDNSGKDLYTVNYVSSSDSRTDDNQKLISAEAAFANYIGNITNNHSGTQVNTKYFGDPSVGFQTYFATDTAERNYPMKPGYSEKKDLFINDSAGNMILYLNSYFPEDTSVTASDYFHTLGVEGFENATGINANINGTSPAFGKISENLANDAKFGTVSGTSDFNTINVISTKGNLTNDLDAVGFKQTDGASTEGNRGIEDIIKESEDQDEYLLINIDATDFSEYTINQLFVDGVGADSDNEYPRQGSHIVYNLLQKSGDKYVPYTGTVLTSGVVVGMIFAPEATVKQFAKVNGSIVAKNVERVSGCGEVHQKSFGSGSTRSIEMSVSNSGATGSLIIKKNVLVNGNTTTTKLADGTYNFIIKGTKDTSTAEVSTTATVKIENGVSNTATVSGLVPGEYTVTENMDGLTDTKLTTGKDGQKVTVVAGATAEELKTAEFTNDKTAVVSLSVEKNFLGSGNELAKINKVELQLLANSMLPDNSGTGITVADNGYKTLTTSTTAINGYYHWGADELKASWSNLPKYDNSGNEITYTVKEINNNDSVYKVYYNGAAATSDSTASFDENGVVRITNCELTSVSGTKTWNDSNNQDSKRPSSITIRLLANGTEISNRTVTANDGWAWSFGNLLKYSSEGKEISYTITEDAVADYGTQINGYNVTNTYTPGKTSVTVTKVWNDENNKDNIRPGSVSVQLYADGTAKGDVVTLSAFNNWRYTWTGLDQKNNGNDISYTVDEVSVPSGYSKSVSGNASSGFTITNTHTPSTPKTPTTPNTPTDTTTTVGQVLGSALGVMNSSMPISAMTIAGRSAAATGDDSNMETYGAITVTGLAGLLAWLVVFMKKKRKQEKHN
ncbi:MAG: Cna B-type domain-containing protein [Lachnospiraceae bacterium]